MFSIENLFTPFARTRQRDELLAGVAWIGVILLLWSVLPLGTLIPKPLEILDRLGFLITQRGLIAEMMVSTWLTLQALIITALISLVLCYSAVFGFMRPLIRMIASARWLGPVGFTYLFFLLIHDGHWIKVAALVSGMLPYFVTAMAVVVSSIPDEEFEDAATMNLGPVGTTWEVIIRGRFDQALEVTRQTGAMAWMMVVSVETIIRTEGGIGVMMFDLNKFLRIPDVFAIILTIYAFGLALDSLWKVLRYVFFKYATIGQGSI